MFHKTTLISFIILQIITSVGLDKKLYTFDSTNKKATFCAPYDAPFSSLVFRDDGNVLAAGTNSGRVVFYDIRGNWEASTFHCSPGLQ